MVRQRWRRTPGWNGGGAEPVPLQPVVGRCCRQLTQVKVAALTRSA